jgi:hypothetical protein
MTPDRFTTTPVGRSSSGPARSPEGGGPSERKGSGAGLALLALPILCCGGPAIVAALGAASVATLGVVGGVVGGFLVAFAVVLWVRHHRRRVACCPPMRQAAQP